MTEPVKNKPETLCWDCGRAVFGCSWSRDFIPVKGWTAEATTLGSNNGHGSNKNYHSYRVTACPEYLPEVPESERWEKLKLRIEHLKHRERYAKHARVKAQLALERRWLKNAIEKREIRIREQARKLDTQGCNELILGMMKLYNKDWRSEEDREQIRKWLRSDMCRTLLNVDPDKLEAMMKKSRRENDPRIMETEEERGTENETFIRD